MPVSGNSLAGHEEGVPILLVYTIKVVSQRMNGRSDSANGEHGELYVVRKFTRVFARQLYLDFGGEQLNILFISAVQFTIFSFEPFVQF